MFNSYEELKAAVASRRAEILTLEVDMGSEFSQEHEDAKKELVEAGVVKNIMGGQSFLGGDPLEALKAKVEETRPPANSIFVQYKKLDLAEWSALMKTQGLSPVDQYEKVLPKTFIGVYGVDPVKPDDVAEEDWTAPEPLTTDASTLSSKGNNGILPGGGLHQVVQSFMAWQNSGGDVSVRPTRSGRA